MYALILTAILTGSTNFPTAAAIGTIPNFATLPACNAAASAWIAQMKTIAVPRLSVKAQCVKL